MSRLVVFDLDGTVYRGADPTPGAAEAIKRVRRAGVQVRFLTNNSSQTPGAICGKLNGLGIDADPDEVRTSALGTASYLKGQGIEWTHVVGESGLLEALDGAGIGRDRTSGRGAVVAGICRSMTYAMVDQAREVLEDPAVAFVATNRDATYPLEGGRSQPGAGAIVAAIAACVGREPYVVGKPNPLMIHQILVEAQIAPEDALVVGDRVETDIAAGLAAGCRVCLVLCGVTPSAPPGVASALNLSEVARRF